jgi:hypothetical protein
LEEREEIDSMIRAIKCYKDLAQDCKLSLAKDSKELLTIDDKL